MSDSEKDSDNDVNMDAKPAFSSNKAQPENLPWVEKYRPSDLSQLISHKEIIATSKFLFQVIFPYHLSSFHYFEYLLLITEDLCARC